MNLRYPSRYELNEKRPSMAPRLPLELVERIIDEVAEYDNKV